MKRFGDSAKKRSQDHRFGVRLVEEFMRRGRAEPPGRRGAKRRAYTLLGGGWGGGDHSVVLFSEKHSKQKGGDHSRGMVAVS